VLGGQPAVHAEDTLSREQQGQIFDEAIHILGGNVNVISRWEQDVRLRIVGRAGDSSASLAEQTLAEVTGLVDRRYTLATEPAISAEDYLAELQRSPPFTIGECEEQDRCGNFVVVFASAATMKDIASTIPLRPVYQRTFDRDPTPLCFFSPFQTGYMEIRQALVYVRDDLSTDMLRTCLQEEIYQSFGMFNDAGGSRYFSFNNVVEPKSITRYDRALLQAIYDPAFAPGAPAFRVVKRLMENLGFDPFGQ
jgi:hypothetical protein